MFFWFSGLPEHSASFGNSGELQGNYEVSTSPDSQGAALHAALLAKPDWQAAPLALAHKPFVLSLPAAAFLFAEAALKLLYLTFCLI